MSLAQINTKMAAAVAALEAGDYATALTNALCAQGLVAASPTSEHGNDKISWQDNKIADFVANVRRAQAADTASGGMQQTKVTYVRPTS